MKVCHVITSLDSGGAESMLLRLVVGSKDCEHFVIVLRNCGDVAKKISNHGVEIRNLNLKLLNLPLAYLKLIYWLWASKPDVIQSWLYHANILSLPIAVILGKPIVWNIRSSINSISRGLLKFVIVLGARFSHWPSRVIYNSRKGLESHLQNGYSSGNSVVIPNGFELNSVERLDPSDEDYQKMKQLSEEAVLLLCPARFHSVKDHRTLFQGFEAYLEQYQCEKDVHLVCIGRDFDRMGVDHLTSLKDSTRSRIHILGFKSNALSYYSLSRLVLLTSLSEGFPNVLGEAMLRGIPCISTDVGDCSIILGEHGKLIECSNPEALASAIDQLLSLDLEEYKKLGEKAKNHIVENFNIDEVLESFFSIYKSVVPKS